MLESKLIEIFTTLSSKELSKLENYVKSPLFNKSDKIIQLFQLIKKEHPHYNSNNLLKERVYKKLFPNKKGQDSSLRALMSQLTRIVEDFLIFIEFDRDKNHKNLLLLRAMNNRRMAGHFEKKYNQINKALDKDPVQSIERFLHNVTLSDVSFQHRLITHNRAMETGLQELMDELDIYFVASKLRFGVAILNRQNILDKQYNISLLSEVMEMVGVSDLYQVPFIQFYYHLILLLSMDAGSEEHFIRLRELLEDHPDVLDRDELRQVYTFMTNYCNKQIKSRDEGYLRHLFELYKEMINKNLLAMEDNYMSPYFYRNITRVALKLRDFDWAEEFIDSHKQHIYPDHRESLYHFVLADLNFHRARYDEAKTHLLNVELNDAYSHITYRILLIKTYYELDEVEVLSSNVESFRIYLLRDRSLSEYNIKACQNFVNFVKRLLRLQSGGKRSPEQLVGELLQVEPIIERQWLKEKVQTMIDGR